MKTFVSLIHALAAYATWDALLLQAEQEEARGRAAPTLDDMSFEVNEPARAAH